MGQKVHPTGFRLGISTEYTSKWYAGNKDYSSYLLEDYHIREYLKKQLENASVSKIVIERPTKEAVVNIYTSRPGIVIGKKGEDIEKFRNKKAVSFINRFNELSSKSLDIGSNNWVLSGKKTIDGNTYMANDPHRTIAVPSLRYMAHMVAPGWNVIGGGEPEIPGISIGHNEYGAWGLTVFRTDGEDLYQYDLNPKNPFQYMHNGKWKDIKTIKETLSVKGEPDREIELHYTHHGPITYLNKKALKAFAVRCAWLEPGGSPYLASLRMDQAKNWQEFREACSYSCLLYTSDAADE